jgi:hypothetical protein
MDRPEYSHLLVALHAVPDPRQARGRRYAWPLQLTLIAAALASGERNVFVAIGQWVAEHAEELRALLDSPRGRLPSRATLRNLVADGGVDNGSFRTALGGTCHIHPDVAAPGRHYVRRV